LLHNGFVFDETSEKFVLRDVAIRNGRVSNPNNLKAPEIIDCSDNLILPSFRDAHVHFSHWVAFSNQIDLSDCDTNEILQRLKRLKNIPIIVAGQWVSEFSLVEKQNFRQILDKISDKIPIIIYAKDLHSAWMNTDAFRKLDWMEKRQNEPREICRNKNGSPTGIVREIAVQQVEKLKESQIRFSDSELQKAQNECFRRGVTSVISIEDEEGVDLLSRSCLQLDIHYYLYDKYLDKLESGWRPPENKTLHFAGIKTFLDGSFGSRTAWMNEPYQNTKNSGISLLSDDKFRKIIRKTHALKIPVMVHSIGDRASRQGVQILYDEQAGYKDRIEHFQIFDKDTQNILKKSNIIVGMQPCHSFFDYKIAEEILGKQRMKQSYAMRSVARTARLELGSDAPVETINPMYNVAACDTIIDVNERLSRLEAIRFSIPNQSITIQHGMLADLVVYPTNILTMETTELIAAESQITFSNGNKVWMKN